jgi:hypothetical protein
MARTNYEPEIRKSMTGRTRLNTKPPLNARSQQAQATDKVLSGRMAGTTKTDAGEAAPDASGGGVEVAKMQHAAGIAHAILGNRRMV